MAKNFVFYGYFCSQVIYGLSLNRDEHQNNFHGSPEYHSILSEYRITHCHDFNWDDVKILYHDKNKKERIYGDFICKEQG